MSKKVEIFPNKKTDFRNPGPVQLDERDETLWINNVLGVNKEGHLPARFLSGFLSTFGLAQAIEEQTKGRAVPTVRIFIPAHISETINGIDSQVVQSQLKKGTELVKSLVKNHFPTINVFFEKDQPLTQTAIDVLGDLAQLVAEDDEPHLEAIRRNGFKRGGETGSENALIYGSHHLFGWSDLHHAAFFEAVPPFTVINTQPPSEKKYSAMRRQLLERLEQTEHAKLVLEGKRFDLTVMMCDVPHYLLITDSGGNALEPTLNDANSATCGEILDVLKSREEEETTPWNRGHIKKARSDFERLLTVLAKDKREDANNANFRDVLEAQL